MNISLGHSRRLRLWHLLAGPQKLALPAVAVLKRDTPGDDSPSLFGLVYSLGTIRGNLMVQILLL
jgi:hypothetical protein